MNANTEIINQEEHVNTRFCRKCSRNLPKTEEYFPHKKSNKEGFGIYCKECINREKREKRSEKRKLWDKGGRVEGEDGRRCSKCKNIFPSTSDYFNVNRRGSENLDTYCKECRKEKCRELWNSKKKDGCSKQPDVHRLIRRNKIKLFKEQSDGCCKCGEKRHYLLDFHHVDPSTKGFQVGQGESKGWDKIEKEIKKCVLICSNCHRELHHFERQNNMTLEEYLKI